MYKLQQWFDRIQDLFDISGDCWMGLFTAFILWKIGYNHLTSQDAMAYGTAVSAFAYSNRQPPRNS